MVKNKRSFFAVILAFVMMLTLVACGTSNNNNSESARKSETEFTGKAIVVYYSGSGNTKRVADFVADELKADTFEIVPVDSYSDDDLNWRDRSSRVNKEHDDTLLQDIELV